MNNRLIVVGGALALLLLPSAARADGPQEVRTIVKTSDGGSPFAQDVGPLHLDLTGFARMTAYGRSDFVLDRDGTSASSDGTLLPQLRLGARLDSRGLGKAWIIGAELEGDVATGTVGAAQTPDGIGYPGEDDVAAQLRKAYGYFAYRRNVQIGAGLMTSNWGLGLLANDGANRFTPGSARFTDPRGGDRVLRAFTKIGLNEKLGAGLVLAADSVVDDDILLERDERARQAVGAIVLGSGRQTSGGLYAAYRVQDSNENTDVRVLAIDGHIKTRIALPGETSLGIEGEAALINGKTTFAPTMDFDEHDVRQFAAAARIDYGKSWLGGVLDFAYASGDRNFDDGKQNAFKADPNYELGMILFRQVLAAQTARGVGVASDLELVGRPSDDIDRYATRGSVSNTIAVFPRAWVRLIDGLELYGGALVAWTAVDTADPLNTRITGGQPTNALAGDPGRFLGTELDLGARYGLGIWGGHLAVGVEGGAFVPGTAFNDAMGDAMDNVYAARSYLSFDFDGARK